MVAIESQKNTSGESDEVCNWGDNEPPFWPALPPQSPLTTVSRTQGLLAKPFAVLNAGRQVVRGLCGGLHRPA